MKHKNNIISTTIVLGIGFLGLSSIAYAVSPPPDGGYAGGNTAEGQNALLSLSSGTYNTAVGLFSLLSNTKGNFNTAIGAGALFANVGDPGSGEGIENTATGAGALLSNTIGSENTANGVFALLNNTHGFGNTAIGWEALYSNTNGASFNTAIGDGALYSNTGGTDNTAIGSSALYLSTGTGNIAIGLNAGSNLTSGDNNIYLGSLGVATESNTIRIGTSGVQTSAFIRGIRGVTTGNNDAIPVLVDSAGQLGTTSSSRRFKKEIKPMDSASEAILALKPVTFHYMTDKTGTPQFGLIAEEVAEVNPNLVVRDENGEIYTVRYDAVNAMLLNEFLKEHKAFLEEQQKVQQLEAKITEQQKDSEASDAKQRDRIHALAARLDEQGGQIQRMSAQIEVCKFATGRIRGGGAASQTVASDQ